MLGGSTGDEDADNEPGSAQPLQETLCEMAAVAGEPRRRRCGGRAGVGQGAELSGASSGTRTGRSARGAARPSTASGDW